MVNITSSHFDNDGEVDCSAHYVSHRYTPPKIGRLSIRRVDGTYELYFKPHDGSMEAVLMDGTLYQVVLVSNRLADLNDTVKQEVSA